MAVQPIDAVEKAFQKLTGNQKVKAALDFIEADLPVAKQDQIELVQIEAPTGQESRRAE